MSVVTELGYLGLGVRDLAAWKTFAANVLGLEVVPDDNPGRCRLRMDYWYQRFILTESGSDDLDFIGWRVANAQALDETQRRLRDAGIAYEVATDEQCEQRQVLGMIRLQDPAGVLTEVFYGPRVETGNPFYPGRRMHGSFLTGDRGLGHVVLEVPDPERSERFYTQILGMRGSIEYELNRPNGPSGLLYFMSCNPRQHSLAFGHVGSKKRLIHVMTELERIEDVGLARDIVKHQGVPIRIDIGQHHNDHTISFYPVTPSGWIWEYGWGVSPPSGQAEWAKAGIWGHEFVPPAG